MPHRPALRSVACAAAALLAAGGTVSTAGAAASTPSAQSVAPALIPAPASEVLGEGHFVLTRQSRIIAWGTATPVADQLRNDLRPGTGYRLPVVSGPSGSHDITLQVDPSSVPAGQRGEGYVLDVSTGGVSLRAATAHGLFNGVQTIRQLLPAYVNSPTPQAGPWTMPAVHLADHPRFTYRGFMLDIARHYESPASVERLLDEVSRYKINVLHLHLSDDQGFRIVVNGFPRLTRIGAQGSVGTDGRTKDPGGFWTQQEYRDVVAYAAQRFMTVIPEVDSPGHNNGIIMSEYNDFQNPRLNGHPHDINCSVNHPPKWDYTEDVGYSALCPSSANTWAILRTIIRQLTALSPGPLYDLGGDEVPTTVLSQQQYAALVNREARIVTRDGKRVMGWADISSAGTNLPPGSVAEYWNPASGSAAGTETATDAVAKGMQLVMAPATHAYLDQKYAPNTPPDLGLTWACQTGCDVDQFYNWDPVHYVSGIHRSDVLGVEGTLFSETIRTTTEAEYMIFPRLQALAEIGWSPNTQRTATSSAYADFLRRLAVDGQRMVAAGINFYRSPEVHWIDAVGSSRAAASAH